MEIVECELCDEDGLRPNNTICDHVDYGAIAAKHMPGIRQLLKKT